MKIIFRLRFFLFLSFSFVLVWSIGVSRLVQARGLEGARALASGEPIENDLFLAEQQIVIDQPVNGDVYVLGNQVQVSGDINGSLFALGQNIEVLGKVSGTTYAAAVTFKLGPQASLARNLYYIGGVLTAEPGATIMRDLNTVCLDAKISGQIGRTTNAMIGVINLANYLIERFGGKDIFPKLSGGAFILPSIGAGSANALLSTYLFQAPVGSTSIDTAKLAAWLLDRLRDFGLLLLLGAVFYWLFRSPLERTQVSLRSRPLAALGYGMLALLIITNVFLVGLLVAALLFVIGLWIGYLGMWGFAFAFWSLSYAALALLMSILWFIVAYGTKLLVAYWIGTQVFGWIRRDKSFPRFVALAVGVLIYVLLRSIPMVGWVLGVLATGWGLGAIWLAYYRPAPEQQLVPNVAT